MRTRLVIGLIAAASTTGLWTAAQASPAAIVGGVVASVVGAAISNHNQPRLASCTLYDQDGRPVQVSCPADAPGAVPPPGKAARRSSGPELAGGPPPTYADHNASPYAGDYADQTWDRYSTGDAPAGGPPPSQMTYLSGGPPDARCLSCTQIAPPPPPVDCGCEAPAYGPGYDQQARRDNVRRPRAVTSFLGGASGYSSYEESSEHVSGYYEEQSGYAGGYGYATQGYGAGGLGVSAGGHGYGGGQGYAGGYGYNVAGGYGGGYGSGYASGAGIGYGLDGGVGYSDGGFYPYGAYGYQNGGYGYRARVAGRDPNGFLTWPGKR